MKLLACLLGLSVAIPAAAQRGEDRTPPTPITVEELAARLRFLSSDLFEGRYPGTRGELLTLEYLKSELESFGVQPYKDDEWLQPVGIVLHDPDPTDTVRTVLSGRISRELEHGRDLLLSNYTARPRVETSGELVFVGYGIDAPVYQWNDLQGVDLRGKIAIIMAGEPILPGDTTRFNGPRASRFSWTADKYAELEAKGAVGVLLLRPGIASPNRSATGARRIGEAAAASTLLFTGSISDAVVASLLPPGSPPMQQLIANAGRPGFRAVPLGVQLSVKFQTKPYGITSYNVIGVIPGSDPRQRSEHVVISSHWDAFGIGRAVNGDSIYNGALDDGSGVTVSLALARYFAQKPEPRSITVLFTTAEEWGLIGAEAFVCQGPLVPDRIVANLNIDDGVELFGVKRDVAPLGVELSSLGRTVEQVARTMRLRVSPDPFPQEGFFLRADNYPFARAGIPALYMALGTDAVDQPAGWADTKVREYLERHYHRPSDDFKTVVVDMAGSLQFANFVRAMTTSLATGRRPDWNDRTEFTRLYTGEQRPRCR